VDCWNGEDDEPVVTHGHTMMSKIKLRDVLQTLKEFAFIATPYPYAIVGVCFFDVLDEVSSYSVS
jgi:hypothetical protein